MASSVERAERFRVTQYSEGRTSTGDLVKFSARPEDVEKVREALDLIHTLHFPQTHSTEKELPHGGYAQYSRYDMEQHKYAGGGSGYIEVLEIKEAPDNRHGIVIHEWDAGDGARFSEFDSIQNAIAAFSISWGSPHQAKERIPQSPGFIRRVDCGRLTPWFYAIGREELVGDFAVPNGLEDDPVFRLGQKFVVEDRDGNVSIRACMGTRYLEQDIPNGYYNQGELNKRRFRMVYFDDGSCWKEGSSWSIEKQPRVLREEELWVVDAMREFQNLLAGKQTEFSLEFPDGNKFIGRLERSKSKWYSVEGRYSAVINFTDGTKSEGWFDFKPTTEYPTVQELVSKRAVPQGKTLLKMEITREETKPNGKKWSGVFYSRGE